MSLDTSTHTSYVKIRLATPCGATRDRGKVKAGCDSSGKPIVFDCAFAGSTQSTEPRRGAQQCKRLSWAILAKRIMQKMAARTTTRLPLEQINANQVAPRSSLTTKKANEMPEHCRRHGYRMKGCCNRLRWLSCTIPSAQSSAKTCRAMLSKNKLPVELRPLSCLAVVGPTT